MLTFDSPKIVPSSRKMIPTFEFELSFLNASSSSFTLFSDRGFKKKSLKKLLPGKRSVYCVFPKLKPDLKAYGNYHFQYSESLAS